jgi:hypothetical protein
MSKHRTMAHPQAERGNDLYNTPPCAVQALLRVESLPHIIWEPSAGRGAIAQELRSAGHTVIASDLIQYNFPLNFVGGFLEQTQAPVGVELILTNPPYKRAVLNRYVAHALDLCPRVIMLLRLEFLTSIGRTDILENRGLARVHIFRNRLPMMHRDGWTGKKASSQDQFCWFVWERGHQGPHTPHFITAETGNPARRIQAPALKETTTMTTKPNKPQAVDDLGIPDTTKADPPPPPEAPIATAPEPEDPFDVSKLRLDQNFVESAGVKKLLTTVPVRKPNPQDFVRVNPDPAYRATLAVIELKEDRETYLLTPSIAHELPGEFSMVMMFTAINRQNVVHLWPVRLPASDGRQMEWHRSALDAADMAMRRWIRVKANMSLGAYEIVEATTTAEPEWPAVPFRELLRIGFRDRLVDRLDHAVIKRLRGV